MWMREASDAHVPGLGWENMPEFLSTIEWHTDLVRHVCHLMCHRYRRIQRHSKASHGKTAYGPNWLESLKRSHFQAWKKAFRLLWKPYRRRIRGPALEPLKPSNSKVFNNSKPSLPSNLPLPYSFTLFGMKSVESVGIIRIRLHFYTFSKLSICTLKVLVIDSVFYITRTQFLRQPKSRPKQSVGLLRRQFVSQDMRSVSRTTWPVWCESLLLRNMLVHDFDGSK